MKTYNLAFFIAALGIFVLPSRFLNMLDDADCFWHLQTGIVILQNLHLPDAGVFSYSSVLDTWINHSWLYDAIIAWLFKVGGFAAMVVPVALLSTASVYVVARYCLRQGFGTLPTLIAIISAAAPILAITTLRPHQITLLFCASVFYILSFWRKSLVTLAVLAGIMICWVNMHGGFLMMFIIIGAFGLESLVHKRYSDTKYFIMLSVIILLATFVNPWGVGIYKGIVQALGGPMNKAISEWHSLALSFSGNLSLIILPAMMIIFGGLFAAKNTLAEKILGFGILFMGLNSIRHLPLAGIFCAPLIAAGVTEFISRSRILQAKEADYSADMNSHRAGKLSRIFLVSSIVLVISGVVTFRDYINASIRAEYLPEKEVAFLLERVPNGGLLNDYNLGGQLIFASNGQLKVFIDGRAETVYNRETAQDYTDMVYANTNWKYLLDKYDFRYAIFEKDTPFLKYLLASENWKIVMETKDNVIMQRTGTW